LVQLQHRPSCSGEDWEDDWGGSLAGEPIFRHLFSGRHRRPRAIVDNDYGFHFRRARRALTGSAVRTLILRGLLMVSPGIGSLQTRVKRGIGSSGVWLRCWLRQTLFYTTVLLITRESCTWFSLKKTVGPRNCSISSTPDGNIKTVCSLTS
jgi:hypothetical protein